MIRTIFLAALLAAALTAPASRAQADGSAGCAAAPSPAAGLTGASLESGGKLRRFKLYLPESYSGDEAVPLVLDLQASGITPEMELQVTGLDRAAERHGFAVALPAAATEWPRGGFTWNIPPRPGAVDDVAFIADLLDALQAELCIDPGRVYAVGYSGGGRLASQLACALPQRIAAIAVVAGLRHPRDGATGCAPGARPLPVLAFHSLDDPVNAYRPDPQQAPRRWRYGVEEALRRWAVHNGCAATPEETSPAEGIARLRYRGCAAGSALEFYRLEGSGHTWPGSGFDFPDFVGAAEPRLGATALMVDFLFRYRLPPG